MSHGQGQVLPSIPEAHASPAADRMATQTMVGTSVRPCNGVATSSSGRWIRLRVLVCVAAVLVGGVEVRPSEPPPPVCVGSPPFRYRVQGSLNGGTTWTSSALAINCDAEGDGDGEVDFSSELLDTLDETELYEEDGLRGTCLNVAKINWNKNCIPGTNDDYYEPGFVKRVITCDPLELFTCGSTYGECPYVGQATICDRNCCSALTGFNDWPAIRLDFQTILNRINPPYVPAISECPGAGGEGDLSPLQCFGAPD